MGPLLGSQSTRRDHLVAISGPRFLFCFIRTTYGYRAPPMGLFPLCLRGVLKHQALAVFEAQELSVNTEGV